jgi:tetraacyldisaccharide 4'-kinase
VFATLREAGVTVAATRSFADHHRYTPADARDLCRQADAEGLTLVTTEKDTARLQGDEAMAELAVRVCVLPVGLVFEQEAALGKLLADRIAAVRATRFSA